MNLHQKYGFKYSKVILLSSMIAGLGGCSTFASFQKQQNQMQEHIIQNATHTSVQNNNEQILEQQQKEETVLKKALIQKEKEIQELNTSYNKKEERFNFKVKNAPIEAVLSALVNGSSYSLVLPEKLTGNVSFDLKNVTAFDVLQLLKNVYNYDYSIQDKTIIVYPNGVMTKIFTINHLIGTRDGQSEIKVKSSSLSGGASNSTQATANGITNIPQPSNQAGATTAEIITKQKNDFWQNLSKVLTIMVGNKDGDMVIVSPETNTVVVKAMPSKIIEVEKYLQKIQAIVNRQVVIEAKIVEVQLNNGLQTGINWAAFQNNPNSRLSLGFTGANTSLSNSGPLNITGANNISATPGSALGIGNLANNANGLFSLAFQTGNFASLLNFLQTQGNVEVLSSPRIATLNNQKALLKVGTDQYFVTNVTTTSTTTSAGTTSTPSVTTQPFFSGIALDITPEISKDGMVTMDVHPYISKVSTVTQNLDLGSLGKIVLPLASSDISETDSVVRVENDQIVAIGGLMKEMSSKTKNQLPGLGDTPVVGEAFKNRDNSYEKYELVILLKAKIIKTQDDWNYDLDKIKKQLLDFDQPNKDIVVNSEQNQKIEK
jgi:MSHA biogenesis protein MshL